MTNINPNSDGSEEKEKLIKNNSDISSSDTNIQTKEKEKIETYPDTGKPQKQWYKDYIQKIVAFFIKIITFIVSIFTICFHTSEEDIKEDEYTSKPIDTQEREIQKDVFQDLSKSEDANQETTSTKNTNQELPFENVNHKILTEDSDQNTNCDDIEAELPLKNTNQEASIKNTNYEQASENDNQESYSEDKTQNLTLEEPKQESSTEEENQSVNQESNDNTKLIKRSIYQPFPNKKAKLKGQIKVKINDNQNPFKIKFSTFIELDMHDTDNEIKDALDWVPIIRDLLFNCLTKKVNIVSFITGQFSTQASTSKNIPVLRPLVFLTAKRLGFDSYISLTNRAVIFVDIATYKNDPNDLNDLEELFKMTTMDADVNNSEENDQKRYAIIEKVDKSFTDDDDDEEGLDYDNDYDIVEEVSENDDDFLNFYEKESYVNNDRYRDKEEDDADNHFYQDTAFWEVQKLFPQMPSICIKIICTNRKESQAVSYAKAFEEMLFKKDDNGYARYLTQKVTEEELISIRKRNKRIANKTNLKEALNVFTVERAVDSKREDGCPRFIPSIEVDLSHADYNEAVNTLNEIMNNLKDISFAEIVLNFSLEPKGCSINEVLHFMNNKEMSDGIHMKEIKEERPNHFRFAIYNDNYVI
ncbi:hypothetical protein M9Y10_032028 [Tritrichomonas musculus]|uniref:Uncharacterized protein n=1 Tax=Tritrichomonas musculus TaxID=1915356 RepID=A0ABR2H0E9_9EUKA